MFKIGEATTYLSQDIRDNSPSKSSIHNAEEQSSSLSEQAWDSYQVILFIVSTCTFLTYIFDFCRKNIFLKHIVKHKIPMLLADFWNLVKTTETFWTVNPIGLPSLQILNFHPHSNEKY